MNNMGKPKNEKGKTEFERNPQTKRRENQMGQADVKKAKNPRTEQCLNTEKKLKNRGKKKKI